MRLQVAVMRRMRIEAVIREHDRLRILKLCEQAWREDVLVMWRIALAGAEGLLSGSGPARQERDVRVPPGLRNAVVGLQSIATTTEFGGGSRGELVAGRQKYFGAETLKQRAPAVIARKCGLQRADALGSDDRDQPRLTGKRERALVARRIGFTDGREGV